MITVTWNFAWYPPH